MSWFDKILQALRHVYSQNLRIERKLDLLLEQGVSQVGEVESIVRPLAEFTTFDWATIQAQVVETDRYGPTIVCWQGKQYLRRSPNNNFRTAVWYSRYVGRRGEVRVYDRLITFRETVSPRALTTKTKQYLSP